LNPEYPPGNLAHGVPYPVSFVTDARGIVTSKFSEGRYQERRTTASVLVGFGAEATLAATEQRTDHFVLRTSLSNAEAGPGNRITLVLDFAMGDTRHAYAPGADGYRPLRVKLDPQPLFAVHEPVLPEPIPFEFKPLGETVPVFEGRFRLLQDVTLGDGRAFAEFLKQQVTTLAITGVLEYQVCSATVCYPPASLPLRWSLKVLPLDRQRVPAAIQSRP